MDSSIGQFFTFLSLNCSKTFASTMGKQNQRVLFVLIIVVWELVPNIYTQTS